MSVRPCATGLPRAINLHLSGSDLQAVLTALSQNTSTLFKSLAFV